MSGKLKVKGDVMKVDSPDRSTVDHFINATITGNKDGACLEKGTNEGQAVIHKCNGVGGRI